MKKEIERVGFTGSRIGMTKKQEEALVKVLKELDPMFFHHGDCIGSDDKAATIAYELNIKVISHPPLHKGFRAYNRCAEVVRTTKGYLQRNRDIVKETQILIATPSTTKLQKKGGTSYTINYAIKLKKEIIIIWPNGGLKMISPIEHLKGAK